MASFSSADVAPGVIAEGIAATTVIWGTYGAVTQINESNVDPEVAIVTRFHQRALVDNIKLPNGDGVTTTRVQVMDGCQWDVTVRDDSNLTMPYIGDTITILDNAGLLGASGLAYIATVVEGAWDTAPKQAGEATFTVEALTLIEVSPV